MDWYEEYIEEPISPAVKLLRDNGFNITCSCGHSMEIECDLMIDGEMQRLHNLLYNNGYRNYRLEYHIYVDNGVISLYNVTIWLKKAI